MFSFRNVAAAATAALALGAPTIAPAQTTILFNNFILPTDTAYTGVIRPWLDEIETVTEGRVNFEVPEASLAPPPELLTMVQQGIADGGFIMTSFLEKSNPLLQISALPGMNITSHAASVALWRTYDKFFREADKLEDVELLGFLVMPAGDLYSMNDTVFESLADLKGVKFWSLPGIPSQSLGATGAVVTPGPAVRMYEVISGGVVDAFCCINLPAAQDFNVSQFIKNVTELPGGVNSAVFAFFVSSDIWSQISPEDQAAIHAASGEALAERTGLFSNEVEDSREMLRAEGVNIIAASDAFVAELSEAWKPIFAEWIANADALGVDGQAAIDFYRQTVAEVMARN